MKKLFTFCLLICTSIFADPLLNSYQAYWDGFQLKQCSSSRKFPRTVEIIEAPTIYFRAQHLGCYGHALLDGVFPLYILLQKHGLLNEPINLFIEDHQKLSEKSSYRNIVELIGKTLPNITIISSTAGLKGKRKIHFKNLLVEGAYPSEWRRFYFYRTYPEAKKYLYYFKSLGFQDNLIYRDETAVDSPLIPFVEQIKKSYGVEAKLCKNRVLITARGFSRKIQNIGELKKTLENEGYDVVVKDFDKISIKEQIEEVSKAEFLIGTYGSNLTNAIFLDPEAYTVILWHKYSKYFWSRRHCIIHGAFLSLGVGLVEWDKPDYDPRDQYDKKNVDPNFFVRKNQMNILRKDKVNMDSITSCPNEPRYELLNVNMYVDPEEIAQLLKLASNTR